MFFCWSCDIYYLPTVAKRRDVEMAKRVLVVDDEAHIRRLVQVNLEKAGYEVDQAVDGVEGLEKVRTNPPDLIVLDIMMPNLDGMETMKLIQADQELQKIPVIFLTDKAQDRDVFIGWKSGCKIGRAHV